MRLVHTSDWHLGRTLHGVSLIDEQAEVLRRWLAQVRELAPNAVIVAGDVYDRAIPSREAVELLDETLHRLVMELRLPTLLIAGNHDSGERLGFASRILEERGLFIAGPLQVPPRVVTLRDAASATEIDLALIPYAPPEVVREQLADESIAGHQEAMAAMCRRALAACDPRRRKVAVAHAFVVGGQRCESERDLVVGGAGEVSAEVFAGFDYVALGHLHGPQGVGAEHVRYSGSPLKYSFSEVAHDKGFSLVELGGDGRTTVEHVPLPPRRDLRIVEGTLAEVLAAGRLEDGDKKEDFICARLGDRGVLVEAMAALREVYPNALRIDRPSTQALDRPSASRDPERASALELFEGFVAFVRPDTALSASEREVVCEAIARAEAREREAGA